MAPSKREERAPGDDLAQAFLQAAHARRAGREVPAKADAASPASSTVAWAHAILAARSEVNAAESCPPAVVRRIAGWLPARPRGVGARLLSMILDSHAARAAAPVRSIGRKPRLLRFAEGGTTVDVEVRAAADATIVRVAVDPALPGMVLEARTAPKGRPRVVPLDATACGELRLPADAQRLNALFKLRGAPAFRIRDLPLA